MNLEEAALKALRTVAPEARAVNPATPLREQFEIDSFDFLNFVQALHRETGVTVPESDYPFLATLDSCVAYLKQKGGGR